MAKGNFRDSTNWHQEAYEPTWFNQLQHAAQLHKQNPTEARRHARVSFNNKHFCHDCFCCACLVVCRNGGKISS